MYVDDIIITSNSNAAISELIQSIHSQFPLKDLGNLNFFLGIQVQETAAGGISLNQTKYINDLLQKANMSTANPMKTPMVSTAKLTAHDTNEADNPSLYRSLVGGLQYVTVTQPDAAYAVNRVCQFMHSPKDSHWQAVKRILRYLKGTSTHGLHFSKASDLRLTAFCDADWGSNIDDRKSTTGYCVYLGSNLISWASKKQVVVSRSSTEAEYHSLAAVTAELTWLQSLLTELRFPLSAPPRVYCDNLSAVLLAANPILHSRTKHFELDLYFV